MKINGKQLSDTLRTESTPFDIVYSDRTVGDLNGAVRFTAINDTGSAIEKGKVVALVENLSGNLSKIILADADSASMPAFGLTAQSSTGNGDEVDVITFGNLKGIDTSTLDVGDTLYVSTTAGEYTTTAPTGSGSKIQNIGMVVKSDTNGIIKVGGAGRSNATPNLDEGKFFVGNASNESTQSAYQLPTAIGTSGQVLTSNGTNVTFQDASTGQMTVEVKTTDFSAEFNHLYIVDGSAGSTIEVSVPVSHVYQNGFTDFIGDRIKIFNKGDGAIRLREYNLNTSPNLDPTADGSTTWRIVNSRALIELVCTEIYKIEYVIIPQLELDESTLTTTGEVFAYNSYEKAMKALPYIFPVADSTEGKVLQTDGNGTLTFETISEVQLADKIKYVNYVKGTTVTYDPNYNYLAGTTMTANETLVMPIANAGTATLNDLQNKITEIVNMSGFTLTLTWSNVNVNNDYYTSVYDETGEVSPHTGSYSYVLATSKIYRIYSWYTYNSGLGNYYLNYRITALN